MIRYLTLLLLLCWSATSWAQTPKAVITGPKEALAGDMVILDASQSQGAKYLWKLLETDKSYLPVENNLKCIFAARVEQDRIFHFILIAAGTNPNGGPEVDIATHDLLLKSGFTPKPETPTPVDPTLPGPVPGKITQVTYVFEKDKHSIPRPVQSALQSLNADPSYSGVVASYFEDDTTNGQNEVPQQYQIALRAAQQAGEPCLVVQAGDKVVRVIRNPQTESDVTGALK